MHCTSVRYRVVKLIGYILVMQVALIGMNGELMGQYIEFVADRLLHVLGSEKLYKTKCPFEWMEQLSLQ
jgi:ribonucleoside-diphosphate reductase subunit M2